MSAALASLRMGIKLVLAYRLEAAVQVVSASVVALLNWSLWTAIFQGRETVAGRTVAEMTTYVIVAWTITTFYATRVDQLLAELEAEELDEDPLEIAVPWEQKNGEAKDG